MAYIVMSWFVYFVIAISQQQTKPWSQHICTSFQLVQVKLFFLFRDEIRLDVCFDSTFAVRR